MGKLHTLMFSCIFFCLFFRKQKSTVSGWQQKVCGSPSPAKHSASNVKAAVVTQLAHSYYSKNKPLFLFFFSFSLLRKIIKAEQQFPEPLHYMCGLCYFFLRQGVSLSLWFLLSLILLTAFLPWGRFLFLANVTEKAPLSSDELHSLCNCKVEK